MARATYIGAGTNLTSGYYIRNFYMANRDARTASKRKEMTNSTLTLADGQALRRAIKKLGSFEFSEEKETDIKNSVKAFIETYNNALSSTNNSEDASLKRNMKQLKSLANEHASELDKVGITVNSDGTLTRRDALFTTVSATKFEKIFANGSDFMQRTLACAKRIEHRGSALLMEEKNQELLKNQPHSDALLPTGIGQNVNIVL